MFALIFSSTCSPNISRKSSRKRKSTWVLVITHFNMLQTIILVNQCIFFLISKGQLTREVYVAEPKTSVLRDHHFAVLSSF